jgi:hypothetical protein
MTDNVIEITRPEQSSCWQCFNFAELEWRIYEIVQMSTIAETEFTKMIEQCPKGWQEPATFAVRQLREMIHNLSEWHDKQPFDQNGPVRVKRRRRRGLVQSAT